MDKLGRNWYQVSWQPPTEDVFSWDESWLKLPEIIDVLANTPQQAVNIAISCHPTLIRAAHIIVILVGTERAYQVTQEPIGEEDPELLPF